MLFPLHWIVLTSVDESKRLNQAEGRIAYTTCLWGEKSTWYSKKKMNGKKEKMKNGKKKNG